MAAVIQNCRGQQLQPRRIKIRPVQAIVLVLDFLFAEFGLLSDFANSDFGFELKVHLAVLVPTSPMNGNSASGGFMIGLAGPIQFEQLTVFHRHSRQPGCGCELLRLFRRGHRFREPPGFGISGGQRPDEQRFVIMSQLTRAFSQLHRLRPIAEFSLGTGRQNPCQIVQRAGGIRIDLDGLVLVL